MTEVRPEVVTVRLQIRCTGIKEDGRMCNHLVATIPEEQWETLRGLGTTIECRRCRKVYNLSTFM